MLNRKGQSLVLFILLLPIMLGIMALVIDVGNAMVTKNSTDNTIEMVLDLALDKDMEQDKIEELLSYNLEDNQNIVTINDDEIMINSKTNVKGIFSKMFGFSGFQIESEYTGKLENHKKNISKKK